jgi:hypothetical protein
MMFVEAMLIREAFACPTLLYTVAYGEPRWCNVAGLYDTAHLKRYGKSLELRIYSFDAQKF